jgi:acetyl-CoA acetyltransferase
MERCLLGTAIRFCPSITFSPRSNLSIAFGSSRPARLLYQSRRMLKTSAKTNVNGGAIAIGHPLGASGARIMTALVNALEQRGARLQTMCEGGGMANATIIERLG